MTAQQEYQRLATEFAHRGVATGQMFGKPTLKLGTKAVACLLGDGVAFKLGAGSPAHTSALALDGSKLFDPSGKGHPMKDWVWVPATHGERLDELAEAARQLLADG